MSSPNSIRVQSDHIRCGNVLVHPLLDEEFEVLHPGGTLLTEAVKQALIDRGVENVMLHPDDAATMFTSGGKRHRPAVSSHAPRVSSAESAGSKLPRPTSKVSIKAITGQLAALAAKIPTTLESMGPPLKDRAQRLGRKPYNPVQHERLTRQFQMTKKLIDSMIRHAAAGMTQDDRIVHTVVRKASSEVLQDSDQTIATSNEIPENPAISERAIRMSVLGLAIAIEMGWDDSAAQEVGTCALVHDWGIYALREELRLKQGPFSPAEQQEFKQHPLYTFEMLGKIPGVSESIRLAASQVHECLDGSGYPRGLKEEQIHPYAKVLHVADLFVALTEQTWGRPAFVPYDAITYLLHQVKKKRISGDVMRALLEVVTLFPIGSHVELSDGSQAQVIRRGKGAYTTPIVQRLDENRTLRFDPSDDMLIDLSNTEIKIARPLPHPKRQQQRMDSSYEEKL